MFSNKDYHSSQEVLLDTDKFIRRVLTELEDKYSNLFVIFLPSNRFSCEVITPSNERYSLPISRLVLQLYSGSYDMTPGRNLDSKIIENIKNTLTDLCEEALHKSNYVYAFYSGGLNFDRMVQVGTDLEVYRMSINLTIHSI
jgi:hypothetical protein